jgi:hypothetical protein
VREVRTAAVHRRPSPAVADNLLPTVRPRRTLFALHLPSASTDALPLVTTQDHAQTSRSNTKTASRAPCRP